MIYKLLMGIMLICVGTLSWILVLSFWPVQLAEIYNEPFPVEPIEVRVGEAIHILIHYNKTNNYDVLSNKNIVCDDGSLLTLSGKRTNATLGEHKAVLMVIIPEHASTGTCRVVLENKYYINPIRTEERTLTSQDFVIIE